MKVRATITIDIDAADFIEAAEHQRQAEAILRDVRKVYGSAALDFRERRTSRRDRVQPSVSPRQSIVKTGRVNEYLD